MQIREITVHDAYRVCVSLSTISTNIYICMYICMYIYIRTQYITDSIETVSSFKYLKRRRMALDHMENRYRDFAVIVCLVCHNNTLLVFFSPIFSFFFFFETPA